MHVCMCVYMYVCMCVREEYAAFRTSTPTLALLLLPSANITRVPILVPTQTLSLE